MFVLYETWSHHVLTIHFNFLILVTHIKISCLQASIRYHNNLVFLINQLQTYFNIHTLLYITLSKHLCFIQHLPYLSFLISHVDVFFQLPSNTKPSYTMHSNASISTHTLLYIMLSSILHKTYTYNQLP